MKKEISESSGFLFHELRIPNVPGDSILTGKSLKLRVSGCRLITAVGWMIWKLFMIMILPKKAGDGAMT